MLALHEAKPRHRGTSGGIGGATLATVLLARGRKSSPVLCSKCTNGSLPRKPRLRYIARMNDHVLEGLTRKRSEILGAIEAYEAKIAQAKHDLAHVNSTIRMFEADSDPQRDVIYMAARGFFKRGEVAGICERHLHDGPLDTRELAERVMAERGLDVGDGTLRNCIVYKVVQALRHHQRRGRVRLVEKRKGVCVWGASGEPVGGWRNGSG